MSARYRITVDRDALEKNPASSDPKHQLRPIRVQDTHTDKPVRACRNVSFPMGARIVYGDPQADGARVWIEADAFIDSA